MRYNIYDNGGAVESLVTLSGMTVTDYIYLRGDPIDRMEAASKQYIDFLGSATRSSNIVSGSFDRSRLPALGGGQVTSSTGSNVLSISPSGVIPNTYTKITIGVNGLVSSGSSLTVNDIPNLGWLKISTGKPTKLAGYGISDGVTKTNGSVMGVLTASGHPVDGKDLSTKQYTDSKPLNYKTYATGDILIGGYDTPPSGFLRCNGGEVSKTTYAALYSVIGDFFTTVLTVGSGKPWSQQFAFNDQQSAGITGWTTGTSLPVGLRGSQAIVTKNRVYLLGGSVNDTAVANVYTAPINADGTLGVWTTGTTLPGPLASSQAIVTKNRVYLLGGNPVDGGMATVYTAPINEDGTLGVWATGTSLPGILSRSQAIVTKNRVYLLGGATNTYVSTATVYTAPINSDGTLGTWTTGTSLPEELYLSQAIVTKNRVYLIGGWGNYVSTATVYTAPINSDGTLGSWTTGTSLPGGISNSQAIVTKNRVYLLGGFDGSVPVTTVYTAPINADGTLGSWTAGTSLPGVLQGSRVIVTKNRVYLLGGYDDSAPVTTVYTAPFSGGLNDYSSYYIETVLTDSGTSFRLPDYTSTTDPVGKVFVKF